MSAPDRALSYVVRVAEAPGDQEACFAVRKDVFVVERKVPEDIECNAYDEKTPTPSSWRSGRTAYRWAPAGCCTAKAAAAKNGDSGRPSAPWAGSR